MLYREIIAVCSENGVLASPNSWSSCEIEDSGIPWCQTVWWGQYCTPEMKALDPFDSLGTSDPETQRRINYHIILQFLLV